MATEDIQVLHDRAQAAAAAARQAADAAQAYADQIATAGAAAAHADRGHTFGAGGAADPDVGGLTSCGLKGRAPTPRPLVRVRRASGETAA